MKHPRKVGLSFILISGLTLSSFSKINANDSHAHWISQIDPRDPVQAAAILGSAATISTLSFMYAWLFGFASESGRLAAKPANEKVGNQFGENNIKEQTDKFAQRKHLYNFLNDQVQAHERDHGCSYDSCTVNQLTRNEMASLQVQLLKDLVHIAHTIDNKVISSQAKDELSEQLKVHNNDLEKALEAYKDSLLIQTQENIEYANDLVKAANTTAAA